jgi:hypothetical protein
MGNRSLDDFLADASDEATDEDAEGVATDDAASDEEGASTPAVPTDEVDPAVSTYVGWAGECARCGETVRRRWRSDDGPVCPACKSW